MRYALQEKTLCGIKIIIGTDSLCVATVLQARHRMQEARAMIVLWANLTTSPVEVADIVLQARKQRELVLSIARDALQDKFLG